MKIPLKEKRLMNHPKPVPLRTNTLHKPSAQKNFLFN